MMHQTCNSLIQKKIQVSNLQSPARADVFCAKVLKGISRSQLKTGLKEFYINSKKKKNSTLVYNGDIIELKWENPIPQYPSPEKICLKILYEDKNIIAVNKKSGIVTHPAGGNWTGTLVNALNYYRCFVSKIKDEFSYFVQEQNKIQQGSKLQVNNLSQEIPDSDFFRLGIVHRLDKNTSGVIITARNLKTQNILKNQFKKRKIKKYYLAILDGIPAKKKGKIKTNIFRSKKNRKKFDCAILNKTTSKTKVALSAYKVLKTNKKQSLVVFRIFTGRTHQIRVHSRFLGCPVLGDDIYGKRKNKKTPLMLHSYKLILHAPIKKEFKASLPKHFIKELNRLDLC